MVYWEKNNYCLFEATGANIRWKCTNTAAIIYNDHYDLYTAKNIREYGVQRYSNLQQQSFRYSGGDSSVKAEI